MQRSTESSSIIWVSTTLIDICTIRSRFSLKALCEGDHSLHPKITSFIRDELNLINMCPGLLTSSQADVWIISVEYQSGDFPIILWHRQNNFYILYLDIRLVWWFKISFKTVNSIFSVPSDECHGLVIDFWLPVWKTVILVYIDAVLVHI